MDLEYLAMVMQNISAVIWMKWVVLCVVSVILCVVLRQQNRIMYTAMMHDGIAHDPLVARLWKVQCARGRVLILLWCVLVVLVVVRDVEAL